MDLKTQYFQNVNYTEIHIWLQWLRYKNSSRILMGFDTLILNYLQKFKGKNNHKRKKKMESHYSDVRAYYRFIVI